MDFLTFSNSNYSSMCHCLTTEPSSDNATLIHYSQEQSCSAMIVISLSLATPYITHTHAGISWLAQHWYCCPHSCTVGHHHPQYCPPVLPQN